MATVYLGIGTNLGSKSDNLKRAIALLKEQAGPVLACSSFMTTEPWGFESTHTFLNAVVCISTPHTPQKLLDITQSVERQMGRTHKSVGGIYSDRIIDIDILLYDDLILNTPQITIPHPYILDRDFVYIPLLEIAPDIIHPVYGKSIRMLTTQGQ